MLFGFFILSGLKDLRGVLGVGAAGETLDRLRGGAGGMRPAAVLEGGSIVPLSLSPYTMSEQKEQP